MTMTNEEKKVFYTVMKEQIRITDYARELGFTVIRKGRYFSLKEHDSVIIDTEKNCFWRNSRPGSGAAIGHGGSIIDFVMEFEGMDKGKAIRMLSQRVDRKGFPLETKNIQTIGKIAKRGIFPEQLQLPEKAKNMRKVFAYLIKTRCISADIVQKMVDRRQLYQDIYGNCVFVSFDSNGKAVFACQRGTNTFTPFYRDVLGCDYSKCFFINNKTNKLYITESVIDAMSVMTINQPVHMYWNYLVLTGVGKTEAVESYLQDEVLEEIWIGTDNDEAGRKAAELLEKRIRKRRQDILIIQDRPKTEKDWNAVLQRGKRE
ncbi:MAG: toprim domain-containing protein [Lachnospiraceae bacterium]|nr:toprim domain-containing protein [Lachnospiraceae bacterium]MBP3458892.1 toprim domain-containing protein [Lachnospiraceae bacterium]